MTKDEVQKQIVEFYKKFQFVYLLITMGAGKTKGSLDAIATNYHQNVKVLRGLIIVHNVKSRDKTWPTEIAEYHPWLLAEIKDKRVHIVHRKDVCKIKDKSFDWVIWDESQEYKWIDYAFFKQNVVRSIIFMSGTKHDDPKIEKHIRSLIANNVLEINTETAIDGELINDYRLKIIDVELSGEHYDKYIEICKRLDKTKYITKEAYEMMIGVRMNMIYQSVDKMNAVKQFSRHLQNKRRLLFTTTKDACTQLSKYHYYSGSSEKDLLAFMNGTIDELATIRQLKTGANIKNFNHILCQQINKKQSNFMQILGRLFRLAIGETGYIYLFCLKGTQDEFWVDKATMKIPASKKKRYPLCDMTFQEIIDDVI